MHKSMKLLLVILLVELFALYYSIVKAVGNVDQSMEELFDAFVFREECSNEEADRCTKETIRK